MNPIGNLNKAFDSRLRLGIMSILMANKTVSFNELKEVMEVTDGNLASHLRALEGLGYISVTKGFVGRKTNTLYTATANGSKAFRAHIKALNKMIEGL